MGVLAKCQSISGRKQILISILELIVCFNFLCTVEVPAKKARLTRDAEEEIATNHLNKAKIVIA
jgi:hypothetical protein